MLDKLKILHDEHHKNVSADRCVGICCPFCSDKSYHGGIFTDGINNFTCWKCKTNVSFYRVIKEITNISYDDFFALTRASKLDIVKKPIVKEKKPTIETKEVDFPKYYEPILNDSIPTLVKKFISKRNYTINDCIKYKAGYCKYGEYANRFIIPIFNNGMLVAFQGRDMTGRAEFKYKTSPISLNPINNFLYGYDCISRRMIILEGVFDKWRIGDDAVCSFGASLTDAQKKLVIDKCADEVIFGYERNMYLKSKRAAKELKPFIRKTKVLLLPPKTDPDTLGKDYIENLIQHTNCI